MSVRGFLVAAVAAAALGASGFAALDYMYGPAGTWHDGAPCVGVGDCQVGTPEGTYHDVRFADRDGTSHDGTWHDV